MSKKQEKNPLVVLKKMIEDLECDFRHHADILENGCSDPTWPDGANLNLVRNHIFIGIRKIRDHCIEHSLKEPDICQRKVPDEVDNEYMAKADEIRGKARKTMDIFLSNPDFQYLESLEVEPADKNLRERFNNVLNYMKNLEWAINEDNLVYQRSYSHSYGQTYLESFASMAQIMRGLSKDKLRERKADKPQENETVFQPVQLSLF